MSSLEALAEAHAAWWIDMLGEQNHIGGMDSTRWLAARARLRAGDRVLDCGAFVGAAARYVASKHEADAVALDIAPDFLRTGRELPDGVAVSWVAGSADRLPFADSSFRSVWCLDSLIDARELTRVAASQSTLCLCSQVRVEQRGGITPFIGSWTDLGWSLFAHQVLSGEAIQTWRRAEAELVRRRSHFQGRYGQREYLSQLDMLNAMLRSYEIGEMAHGLFVFTRG